MDRKQVQCGLAVTGDGGIPVFHRAYDGKAGEVNQVVAAMEALKTMAGQRSFSLVGDSKLVSYANLPVIAAAEGGQADFLDDHQTGRLVPTGSVQRLADAIRSLATSPEARTRIAAHNRKLAAGRTVEAAAKRYETLFTEAARQPKPLPTTRPTQPATESRRST